ncbi:hypothetical protein B0H17DRAFT_1100155, partial [Mycena rosella]
LGGMCLVLFGVVGGGTAVGICADSVHGRRRPCRGECRGVACRVRCPLESSSLFCCIAGMRRHLLRSANADARGGLTVTTTECGKRKYES